MSDDHISEKDLRVYISRNYELLSRPLEEIEKHIGSCRACTVAYKELKASFERSMGQRSPIWKYSMTWDQQMGARGTQMRLVSDDWESMWFTYRALKDVWRTAMERSFRNLTVTCDKGDDKPIQFDPDGEWPRPPAILP